MLSVPGARPRILVIRNPTAGGAGSAFEAAALAALERRATIDLRDTARKGDAEAWAREAAGYDRIAVAGGDGTIGEAIAGLLARDDAPSLGIVPLGTANVLAAELDLPADPVALADLVAEGAAQPIRVGLGNGRPFAMMAGVGFDAHVVEHVSPSLKRKIGKGAYVLETLRRLMRFGFPVYDVVLDGIAHRAASVIVAKGHFYGGRFVVCPDARVARPSFQVALFERSGGFAALGYAAALTLGILPRFVRLVFAETIEIAGPAGDPVQGDGDTIARLPVAIRIAPRPILVIAGGLGQGGGGPI